MMGDLARTMINTGTRARESKEIRLPRLPFGLLSFHSWVATTIFMTSIFVECGNCGAGSWVCDRPGRAVGARFNQSRVSSLSFASGHGQEGVADVHCIINTEPNSY